MKCFSRRRRHRRRCRHRRLCASHTRTGWTKNGMENRSEQTTRIWFRIKTYGGRNERELKPWIPNNSLSVMFSLISPVWIWIYEFISILSSCAHGWMDIVGRASRPRIPDNGQILVAVAFLVTNSRVILRLNFNEFINLFASTIFLWSRTTSVVVGNEIILCALCARRSVHLASTFQFFGGTYNVRLSW